jgi:hypothetical protein
MARVVSAGNLAQNATLNQDVLTGGAEFLSITSIVGTAANAAAAAADNGGIQVLAYMDDGTVTSLLGSLAPPGGAAVGLPLPVLESTAAAFTSPRAWMFVRVRVAGIRAVQIQAKQGNAAAKPVEINYDLG